MSDLRLDLNPYLNKQSPFFKGDAFDYYGTAIQRQNRLDARIEAMKYDRGFLGANAFGSVLEENFLRGPVPFVSDLVSSFFLDRGQQKLTPDELRSRYSGFHYNFKVPMTDRAAREALQRDYRIRQLEQINTNFNGADWQNKILFSAPTILAAAPEEAAVYASLGLTGAAVGGIGGAVAGVSLAVANTAAKGYKAFKLARRAQKAARVLQTAGKFIRGRGITSKVRGVQLGYEIAHDAIVVNGVSAVAQGISDYYQNSTLKEAAEAAAVNFGIGLVASPALDFAGRGLVAGAERVRRSVDQTPLGQSINTRVADSASFIRQNVVQKHLQLRDIAESIELDARSRVKVNKNFEVVDGVPRQSLSTTPDRLPELEKQTQLAEATVEPEKVGVLEETLDAQVNSQDVVFEENTVLNRNAPESIEEFLQANDDLDFNPDDFEDVDIAFAPAKEQVKADVVKMAEAIRTHSDIQGVARNIVDVAENDLEAASLIESLVESASKKLNIPEEQAAATAIDGVLNNIDDSFNADAIINNLPVHYFKQTETPNVFKREAIDERLPEVDADAVTARVAEETPFIKKQQELATIEKNLVDRFAERKRLFQQLDKDTELAPIIQSIRQEASVDPALLEFFDNNSDEAVLSFLAHLEDDSISAKIDQYLDCKRFN